MHSRLLLEESARQAGLAGDGLERTDPQFPVVRDRDSSSGGPDALLHHDVTPPPTHVCEAMLRENAADLAAGEDTQPTQRPVA
jgi:hypothetical protein